MFLQPCSSSSLSQPRASSKTNTFKNSRPFSSSSPTMEFLGANCEREWSSLSGMYTAEEADFMSQLLGNCSFPSQRVDGIEALQTSLWHGHGESLSSEMALDDGNALFPVSSHENFYLSDSHQSFDANLSSMSMDFCIRDMKSNMSTCNVEETSLAEKHELEQPTEENYNSRKRTRNSIDVQRSKRNVKAKKKMAQKAVLPCSNDEDGNGGVNVQSTSSCSEDGSDGSQETSSLSSKKAPALNSNGKTRASRGSATDPQSLYARKRRERINERLKILQNLVPNGTKVDISTMLEEAVEYVKFLQLQIKLLSSDDMWMYAPIAYNGMDIGLDFKVPATKQ